MIRNITSYQELILSRLRDKKKVFGDSILISQLGSGNSGRLIAHRRSDLRTVATLDFDFQRTHIHASLNDGLQPGQPRIGPRAPGIYYWSPGEPKDDTELVRLFNEWSLALKKGLQRVS